ncbi:MAG: hypothetical protein CM1200mP30_33700 [Pseudomonadota bacterium]|nr:MAG: hypothetical protein CM1200mP30_33700 [Pseudomonadota bacterium]
MHWQRPQYESGFYGAEADCYAEMSGLDQNHYDYMSIMGIRNTLKN